MTQETSKKLRQRNGSSAARVFYFVPRTGKKLCSMRRLFTWIPAKKAAIAVYLGQAQASMLAEGLS